MGWGGGVYRRGAKAAKGCGAGVVLILFCFESKCGGVEVGERGGEAWDVVEK